MKFTVVQKRGALFKTLPTKKVVPTVLGRRPVLYSIGAPFSGGVAVNGILTEGGDSLTTEGGDFLITET